MTHGVSRPKDNALTAIFGRSRGIVIGVIHSKPLPVSPSFAGESLDEIYAFAVDEGRRYADAGVDGLILENHGDIPFARPEEIGSRPRQRWRSWPTGCTSRLDSH